MDNSIDSNGIELVSMAALEDEAEKRAHHNALERKRRDHIKDSFYCLRDAVPQLRGEKASRALILNKATDYIKSLKSKNMCHKKEIDDIKKQNDVLEQEIDKIIKLNNSLGKDRIELVGEDYVKVSPNSDDNSTTKTTPLIINKVNPTNAPLSIPPTFTRITEKDRGPYIGKDEVESAETDLSQPTVMKISKPISKSENLPNNVKPDSKSTVRVNLAGSGVKTQPGAKIAFAQASGVTKSGGTIQIPASALAKALPNGFKNVTAIYKQTGNNKPIRLQIITHNTNGTNTVTPGTRITFKNGGTGNVVTTKPAVITEEKVEKKEEKDENKDENKSENIVKNMNDISINTKDKTGENKEEEKEKEEENRQEENLEPKVERKVLFDGHQTPKNQPLYARHRILQSSPSKDKKQIKSDKTKEDNATSEFDSYKTQPNFPGENNQQRSNMQTLERDPSAMATISEAELAFLTRPSTTAKLAGKVVSNDPVSDRKMANKIEHGNIPILYKGSLLSDRDKEMDEDVEPAHKMVLYSARAMDGSRPFACHICGKSFNMLSSLKVHEHIHVPVKKKPYPCDLCHRSFMTLRILSQHKESHFGRISTFHRQSSLGKRSQVSFATHPQNTKNGSTGPRSQSPRTSITNIFHVRASSPKDGPIEKKYSTITITPSANKANASITKANLHNKPANSRVLPTTKVRQGQVIVQARPGGVTPFKIRTKAECEEARNFGVKTVVPLKRSNSTSEAEDKKTTKIKQSAEI